MLTDRLLPLSVTPGRPLRLAEVALACRLVQLRVASLRTLISASAKSTPASASPGPPGMPALAVRPLAPSSRRSTATPAVASLTPAVVVLSAASSTVALLRSKARLPLALKNSPMVRFAPVRLTCCRPALKSLPKV